MTACLGLALLAAVAADGDALLLTRHSPDGGAYTVTPLFTSGPTAGSTISFSESHLTDGNLCSDWKREPPSYPYWQNISRGEVLADLARPCRVRKVRVCVPNTRPHGTSRIEVFARGDPLEFPENLKLADVTARSGWNESPDLKRIADMLRLRFTLASAKHYITVSEIEVWGTQAATAESPASSREPNRHSFHHGHGQWHAFDFGPTSSPTFADFTAVSKDAAYTSEQGYGWRPYTSGAPVSSSNFGPQSDRVPGLAERDRAANKTTACDSLYRDFCMTSAYYHTQVKQTFLLDLPNGPYRVATFHGDQAFGRPGTEPWWIEAEGRRVVENLEMPRALATHAIFDAYVADGQLTLDLDADAPDPAAKGFIINGLAVFPADTDAERAFADDLISKIQAAVKRERQEAFEALFKPNPYVEEAQMPALSSEDKARGLVPFVPHWMATVYPNSVPRTADLTRPLACFACPGEYEPMTVAVRSPIALGRVTCEASDLTGPGTIPASAVEVRTVKCWPQRLGSSWSTEWRTMPELLEATQSVNVPAETTQCFWLTVQVPEHAAPGLYRGTVALRAEKADEATIPMTVEVLPFSLQPNERPVGMYWRDGAVAGTPLRDAQVRDMIAHGMTTLTMGGLFPEVHNEGGALRLDTGPLLEFLRELNALTILGPIPYQTARLMPLIKREFPGRPDADYDALYIEATRQLEAVSARADTPKLLYYPVDEIGDDAARGRRANHECALVARVAGATSYVTVNNYESGERWGDTFDIWCGNVEYTPEQEENLLARGKRYMRYGSAYLNDARKARNSCGFGFYRRPAEAMFYWHYQAINGDPFNDLDGDARDWCAVYPGDDGDLIPTIDWEALREGVDDLKYIATLKHYAALAAQSPEGQATARKALATLEDVLGHDDSVNQYSFRDDLTNDDFHALRRTLADAIIELLAVVPAR
jgi:hypothetical protein